MNKIFILLCMLFIGYSATSQILISEITDRHNACSGTILDSGGESGNYSPDEEYIVTICSDNGSTITLRFDQFDTELNADILTIIDGPIMDAPVLIAAASGTQLRGQSVTSSGNCLTLVWNSNATNERAGFAATISCGMFCQSYYINHLNSTPGLTYADSTYIDVCRNSEVSINVRGSYPDNGSQGYQQSDATVHFHWLIINGDRDTIHNHEMGMNTFSHTFVDPGGYFVVVYGVDENGCRNMNYLEYKIRVSGIPGFNRTTIDPNLVCPGGLVNLNAITQNHIWSAPIPEIIADQTYLPDGSGVSYTSELVFNIFSPNSFIRNRNDIREIFANMEHSYMGDLSMNIQCPNGNTMQIFNQGGQGTILGEPVALGLTVDDNTSNSEPGIGYDYSWSPTSTRGNIHNTENWDQITNYVDRIGQRSHGTINQLRSGIYEITGNWDDLIGCPLNGEWRIIIRDNISSDNGYIFHWGIRFAEDLYPDDIWKFENTIENYTWTGENVTNPVGPVGQATPQTAGLSPYSLTVTDNFGCSYDTIVYVDVRSQSDDLCCVTPQADAGNDDVVCSNIYTLQASLATGNTGEWTVTGGSVADARITDPTSNITQVDIGNMYGTYEFTWTEYYRGWESCSNSATVRITFNQVYDPTLTAISDLCVNANPVQIQAVNLGTLTISPDNGGLTEGGIFNPNEAGPGTYTVTNTITAPCLVNENNNTIAFTVNDEITVTNIVETCIGGSTPYLEVSFDVAHASDGSQAPYTVNGIPLGGMQFVDNNAPASYLYRVRDVNGCSDINVTGYRFCACPLFAGTMSTLQPQILCEGDCINTTFTHNDDQMHDHGGGSDQGIFQFIVHLGDNIPIYRSAELSSICPDNIPGFSFETVYYISPVMGYDDGTGNANIGNSIQCKSISAGTPIIWQQNPVANAGVDKETCGLVITLEGNQPAQGMMGYWTADTEFFTTGGTSRNDHNAIVVVPAFGTFTFVWNIVNGQCSKSDEVEISFKRTPIPFAGTAVTVCGTVAQLNAIPSGQPGSNFMWSGENTRFSPANQASTTASLDNRVFGTYEYTFTETNGQCIGQSKVNVTYIEEPNPIILSTLDTVCGEIYNLRVQASPGASGTWKAYYNNTPLFSANFADEYSPNTSVDIGAYDGLTRDIRFEWTETRSSHGVQCSSSISTTVTFMKQPSARIDGADLLVKCGNEVELNASMDGTFPEAESRWVIKGSTLAGNWGPGGDSSPNTSFTLLEQGIYGDLGYANVEFLWTLTSGTRTHQCVSTDIVTVKFVKIPDATTEIDKAVCGNTHELTAVFSIPESSGYYEPLGKWSVVNNRLGANIQQNDDPSVTNESATVRVSEYGRWDFVFTEFNANLLSCLDYDTVTIEFVKKPSVSISGENYICDSITELTANDSEAQGGIWSVTPDDVANGIGEPTNRITNVTSNIRNTVLTYTWNAYNVSSEEFGPQRCSNSASYDVTFWQEGTAKISTDTTNTFACGNEFCGLQADPPGSQYWGQWHALEPGITIANDTALTTCVTASRLNENYNFIWVVNITGQEEGFCQATSDPFSVFFAEKPEADAGLDTLFCGNIGYLKAIPSTGTGHWTINQSGINIDNPNSHNSRVNSGDNYGEYIFTWIEDNGNGCTDDDQVVIRFVELPSSGITVMPPRCSGEPATIIAVDSLMAHYEWQFNNGIRDSFRVNSQGGEYYNFVHWNIINPSDSIHNVRLIATDKWNCKSVPTRVEIREPHIAKYKNQIISDTCALGKGEIRFNSDHDLSVAFKWIDRDNGTVTRDSSRVYNLNAGDYDVRAYYRSSNTQFHNYYRTTFGTEFCDDTVSITIPLIGMINADIDVDAGVAIDQLVVPAPVTFLNLTDYDNVRQRCEWHFGDGTTVNSCSPTIAHTYSEAGEYIPYLVVINRDLIECRDTAILDIRIIVGNQSSMEIPNVFSPNGDNINDYFQVTAESLESFHGRILNRWGNQVFEWSDWQNETGGWDGLINSGSEASPGVYYFVIKAKGLDGVVHDIEGFLHLMR